MRVADVPTVAEEARGEADIDALECQFCIFCSVREVDPDVAPFCSTTCAIEAEND